MDNAERWQAAQEAKFPEGKLNFDDECEECDEGRIYNNADPTSGQYVICPCVRRNEKAERTGMTFKKLSDRYGRYNQKIGEIYGWYKPFCYFWFKLDHREEY